jgi:uncharacterized membrane protein YcaP (DUF421 family)
MPHHILPDLFALPVPWAEKIIRAVLVYFALVVLLRVFGKRELAQLNPFDLVVLLTLSNTVQNAIIGDDNSLVGGLLGALTLLLTNYLVVRFLFRHRRLDQVIEGKPSVLIRDGEVMKKELARELLNVSELEVVARRQGFEGLHEIDSCVLEPGGAFLFRRKVPSDGELKQSELTSRLDAIMSELHELRTHVDAKMGS